MTCDICVIGAGSGGLTVAAAAAQFGRRVILIEKGKMGGGCLNHGCVPSKALIAAARRAQAMREAAPFGISPVEPQIDFAAIHAHIRDTIASIEPRDSEARFVALGVRVIRAAARFIDPLTVEAGGERITARRFVIATGSSPAIPPIPGLAEFPYLTNETVFDLTERPRHLIIIGGGPVGIELAQAFRRLGSDVTVIEAATPLPHHDPELAGIALDAMVKEGVILHTHAKAASVRRNRTDVLVQVEGSGGTIDISGDQLLTASGRRPAIEGLDLDSAGIASTAKGITVDSGLKTTNRKVYAIGDVAGGLQFTHLANYHAGLVIRNALFRLPVRASNDCIPRVTFTDPELAEVGLSEAQARESHGGTVSVSRASFRDNDRAVIDRRAAGEVKIIAGRGGRLLGAGIASPGAGDLIQLFTFAIQHRYPVRGLAGMVAAYPTSSEAGRQAAINHYAGFATNRWVRRVIGLLASFG